MIHIGWDGPFTLSGLSALDNAHDYGVYQVYGPSPTYGRVELLYIGLASKQTFAVRIPNHTWWIECTRDASQASIYVGRLLGIDTPENALWEKQIALAERLLIYGHYPPYNRQKDSVTFEPEFRELRVFNWGRHRDLLPEVSGARLASMPFMKPYGTLGVTHPEPSLHLTIPNAPLAKP